MGLAATGGGRTTEVGDAVDVGPGPVPTADAVEVVAAVDRLRRRRGEDAGRGGDGRRLDRLAATQLALHLAHVLLLLRGDEGDHRARLAGATGAAGAVDVVLVGAGRVELQDAGDAVDVDAAGRHVGGDEHVHVAAPELRQGPLALALAAVAVDGLGADAGLAQLLRQALGAVAGAAEHDGRPRPLDDGGGHLDAIGVGHGPEAVGDLALLLHRVRLVVDGVGLVAADQHVDVAVERGGEQHRLALRRWSGRAAAAPRAGSPCRPCGRPRR